jgi:hypothetical protein
MDLEGFSEGEKTTLRTASKKARWHRKVKNAAS